MKESNSANALWQKEGDVTATTVPFPPTPVEPVDLSCTIPDAGFLPLGSC